MTEKLEEAGAYKLKKFTISDFFGNSRTVAVTSKTDNIEAKLLVSDWSMVESMHNTGIHGHARINDSVGLYYDFPLRGEEKLQLVYEDYFGNEKTDEFFIYSVSDMRPAKANSSDMITYTLNFSSIGKFVSDTTLIRKAYRGLISEIVADVYDEFFVNRDFGVDKPIEIEPTNGEQTLIIPNFNGSDAMSFLARRAYGGPSNTSSYKFFETRDKYVFATNDYLINAQTQNQSIPNLKKKTDNEMVFRYNVIKDEGPEGQLNKMSSLIDVTVPDPVNTLNDLYNGSYYKRVTELDYLSRKVLTTDYNYFDDFPQYNETLHHKKSNGLKPNHTLEFAEKFLRQGKNSIVVKDYPDDEFSNQPAMRPKTYYAEQISPSWGASQHHNTNKLTIKVYGRNSRTPGDIISVEFNEFRFTPSQVDKKLSGKYIIESIVNEFIGETFYQSLVISRGGIGE